MNIPKIQNYNIQQPSFNGVSPKFKPANVVIKDKFASLMTHPQKAISKIPKIVKSLNPLKLLRAIKPSTKYIIATAAQTLALAIPIVMLFLGMHRATNVKPANDYLREALVDYASSLRSENGQEITENEEIQIQEAFDLYKETYKKYPLKGNKYLESAKQVCKIAAPHSESGLKITENEKEDINNYFEQKIQARKIKKQIN